ncbi:hypothetical protein NIES2101_41805 [Calothrix sp. HK-06]|nr:hypothetical protein NIES2101_41805 [Calothrix sp. HK-06]
MEARTIEALVRAYLSLEQTAIDLYEEFELAVQNSNYNDASLLESQADKVYELSQNLEIIIREQGG